MAHQGILVSRLRHRQFGIFVTTSFIGEQAYCEIREDKHPVLIISSKDIVEILVESGIGNITKLKEWLKNSFPK